MGGVVAASEAPPAGEGNELEPVRNVWYERAALGDGKAAAGLYATLASVHVLRDDLAQARACVDMAMSLGGAESRTARSCRVSPCRGLCLAHAPSRCEQAQLALVYLDLRDGKADTARDIIQRQRLPLAAAAQ